MLDDRWRIVEVVEQLSPLLVGSRGAKPVQVIGKRFPLDEQQLATGLLDAPFQAHRPPALGRHDERSCDGKGLFESRFLPRPYIEDDMFKDHLTTWASSVSDLVSRRRHDTTVLPSTRGPAHRRARRR